MTPVILALINIEFKCRNPSFYFIQNIEIIFTIMMLVPLLIVILKYRKKNKLGMIKSIIGSILVALFFVLTAGVYIPIVKNFVMGPLFLNINKYSFQSKIFISFFE